MAELPTLKRILDELGVELEERVFDRLDRFRTLLLDYNRHTNLTAIRDPLDVEIKLFADSLALLPLVHAEMLREGREAIRVIDIGTGAGFPGLPLAIADPALHVTLVDATRKKVDFLDHAIAELALTNADAVHSRSEDLAHDPGYRERFDIVTARAVAALPALVELALPFVSIGGLALFTKGRDIDNERDDAARALGIVGGDLFDVSCPSTQMLENTAFVQIRKVKPAPPGYPRAPGIPVKSPL